MHTLACRAPARTSRPHATADTIAGMAILLSAAGVAFAAFCIWLGVRIVNRRERWAKRTAVAVLVIVVMIYPLSVGPVVWLDSRGAIPAGAISSLETIYAPSNGWPTTRPLKSATVSYGTPNFGASRPDE